MRKNDPKYGNLSYLEKNTPYRIWWQVIAPKGYKPNVLQESDLIYDEYDLRIRKLT